MSIAMMAGAGIMLGGLSGTVTLSGETVSTVDEFVAGIRVNTDGTIDKLENTTYTQIDAGTDWIIPNGAASSSYQVRVTSVTGTGGNGGNWFSSPGADGTWFELTSSRAWAVRAVGPAGADSEGQAFTLEIRLGTGSTLASTAYSVFSEGTI